MRHYYIAVIYRLQNGYADVDFVMLWARNDKEAKTKAKKILLKETSKNDYINSIDVHRWKCNKVFHSESLDGVKEI